MGSGGNAVRRASEVTPSNDADKRRGGVLGWITRQQWLLSLAFIMIVWQIVAMRYDAEIILPYPAATLRALAAAVVDPETLINLGITIGRVLTGFVYALLIGVPLGMAMGASRAVRRAVSPIVDSVRQVPIMAWVPLTIVWFGLGDGPTIFLITMVGLFPILLSTIAGVDNISADYFNAARSMGASKFSIIRNVVIPAAGPDILTGARLAMSAGWMSVI